MREKSIWKSSLFAVFLVCVIHSLGYLRCVLPPNEILNSSVFIPFPWSRNTGLFIATYFFLVAVGLVLAGCGLVLLLRQGSRHFFSGLSPKAMFYTAGAAAAVHFLQIKEYMGGSRTYSDGSRVVVDSYHAFLVMLSSLPDILLECVFVVLFVGSLLVFLVLDGKTFLVRCTQLSRTYPRRATAALALLLLWAGYWVIIGAGRLWGTTSFLIYRPAVPGGSVIGIFVEDLQPNEYKALVLAYILAQAIGLLALTLASGAFLLWMRGLLEKKLFTKQAVVLSVVAALLWISETVFALSALAPATKEASHQFARMMWHIPATNVYVMFLALLFSSTALCLRAKKEKKPTTVRLERIPEAQ